MKNINVFAVANLTRAETFEVEPWNRKELDYSQFPDKDAFCQHNQCPGTEHCFYTGFEGKAPGKRISKDNPAVRMHALVVDVDENLTREQMDAWIEKQTIKPSFTSRTFSDRWRLVYLFARPVKQPKCGWVPFIRTVVRKLNLYELSSKIDEAIERPAQLYELGRDWQRISDTPVNEDFLNRCVNEAKLTEEEESAASTMTELADIEQLVHQKFPGRWTGEFKVGSRGVRFWDPAADNPSAAVVNPSGMRCYTGEKGFLTWAEIFGTEVIAELEEQALKKLFADIWFDGRRYWIPSETGAHHDISREDMILMLTCKFELSFAKSGNGEAQKALLFLQTRQRVSAAAPFLYRESGRISLDGEVYLNTSRLQAFPPNPQPREWGEGFPFIAEFYERFLPGDEAFDVYMTWLRHFYTGAVRRVPTQGHALVVVGKPGNGKNFQSEMIVGRLMGGSVDASAFITGDDGYNRQYLASPVMRVDDEAAIEDRTARRTYIAKLKKLVANRRFTVSEKYVKNGVTEWMGRVIVTLNDDGESLALLPSLDQSNRDKILFLRAGDEPMPHPLENIAEILDQELPAFGRWLVDYQPPEWLEPGGRFGFKAWQDPELLHESQLSSDGAQFEEVLILLAKDCKSEKSWEGSATELHGVLVGNHKLAALVRNMSPVYVGRQLGKLQDREYIEQLPRGRCRRWRIDFEALRIEL